MINKLLFVVYVLYCLEVGVFLVLFPWLRLWDQNALLTHYPLLRPFFLNNFFRGAVSGLGFANLLLGVWEVFHLQRYFKRA